jgi:uncharacterized protein YndB with AHSA1/START domain
VGRTADLGEAQGAVLGGDRKLERMIEVTRVIDASPEDVMAVLTDGWSYAAWVVGASTIRAVDKNFPASGTRIHHSVGSWPLLLHDTTHVLEYEPGRRLKLEARGWPIGQATIELTVEPDGLAGSRVTMTEDVSEGPGRLVPEPVRQLGIAPRNRETLRRLAYLAERRAEG